MKRGKSKKGTPWVRVLVHCDGTEASGFLHNKDDFIRAVEDSGTVFAATDARAEAAIGKRVAVTLVREGEYINVETWKQWGEDIDQPLPFGNVSSAPAAAVPADVSAAQNTERHGEPPLSEVEGQDREPGEDDEPDGVEALPALTGKGKGRA